MKQIIQDLKKEIEEGRVSSLEVMRDWEDADNAFDAKFNP